MRTNIVRASRLALLIVLVSMLLFTACTQYSESVMDTNVGFNGSFEHVESGLPINWLVYTPKTVPTGNFELIIDSTDSKNGSKSLHFLVRECSPNGGWHSPGICNEIDGVKGEHYMVSFWVKNSGSTFFIRVGSVSAFEGQYDTIVESNETIETWRSFEYEFIMPKDMDIIRIEISVLQPGEFWIDDIRIERKNT